MTGMSRENWSFGAQIVSAIGILVIAVVTFINYHFNLEFRDEIQAEMTGVRTELTSIRSEMHDMNTRLGRVEGYLRVSVNE